MPENIIISLLLLTFLGALLANHYKWFAIKWFTHGKDECEYKLEWEKLMGIWTLDSAFYPFSTAIT